MNVFSISSDGTFKETGTQTCNDGNCPAQTEGPTNPAPTAPLPKGKKTICYHIIYNMFIAGDNGCPH